MASYTEIENLCTYLENPFLLWDTGNDSAIGIWCHPQVNWKWTLDNKIISQHYSL